MNNPRYRKTVQITVRLLFAEPGTRFDVIRADDRGGRNFEQVSYWDILSWKLGHFAWWIARALVQASITTVRKILVRVTLFLQSILSRRNVGGSRRSIILLSWYNAIILTSESGKAPDGWNENAEKKVIACHTYDDLKILSTMLIDRYHSLRCIT